VGVFICAAVAAGAVWGGGGVGREHLHILHGASMPARDCQRSGLPPLGGLGCQRQDAVTAHRSPAFTGGQAHRQPSHRARAQLARAPARSEVSGATKARHWHFDQAKRRASRPRRLSDPWQTEVRYETALCASARANQLPSVACEVGSSQQTSTHLPQIAPSAARPPRWAPWTTTTTLRPCTARHPNLLSPHRPRRLQTVSSCRVAFRNRGTGPSSCSIMLTVIMYIVACRRCRAAGAGTRR